MEQQETDPDSILSFYRKAIALRKSLPAVHHGDYREYQKHSGKLYVYSRNTETQKLLVVCSFSEKDAKFRAPAGYDLSAGKLILCNYAESDPHTLRPYEVRVYCWE